MATTEPTANGVTKALVSDSQSLPSDATAAASKSGNETAPATTERDQANDNQNSESEQVPPMESGYAPASNNAITTAADNKWPGWPGDCVFRLIVPVLKVGSIIGRKGELIKKMCEDTRARIRVLDGAVGTPDRIVLISGKEEPEATLSPAMDAVLRIFKRVSGLSDNEASGAAGVAFCSIRLLVASTQAINLIGKQGSLIKSIQESTGASVRVLSGDDVPFYAAADERIVELQGEGLKVLKALEAVIGHLRKFLVDHSVLPLFEKSCNSTISQERQVDTWTDNLLLHTTTQTEVGTNYPITAKREPLFLERETQLEPQLPSSGISLYGLDPSLSRIRSTGLGHTGAPIVTRVGARDKQIAQAMQIPLSYAEDIIGIEGSNIAYIRRASGAILTVQESRGLPDEITVEIKGTSLQVLLAQRLIQEVVNNHEEPVPSSYGSIDAGLRPTYPQLSSSYPSTSLPPQSYTGGGGYGSSSLRGYSTFRL